LGWSIKGSIPGGVQWLSSIRFHQDWKGNQWQVGGRSGQLCADWAALFILNNQESLPEILMDADDLKKIDELFRRHVDGVKEDVKHHMGIMTEDFQHKLDIVVEGHQMLGEKIDRVEDRLERVEVRLDRVEIGLKRVEGKVDAVATDLSAHRADTEAHHGVYRVRDCGE